MNSKVINIPVSLKRSYQDVKEDKEVFTFAVWIKLTYVDSVYRLDNHSITELQNKLHISFSKAKRLIESAKKDNLFVFSGDRLLVKSFKSKEVKIDRRGRKYTSDYCQKIQIKEYTFKELYNLLFITGNVLGVISSKERRSISTCNASDVELTQREIANATGLSRGYISKLTNKLSYKGLISKTKAQFRFAMNTVNEETVKEFREATGRKNFVYNQKDGSGWYLIPCKYKVLDRNVTEGFQHIIYNAFNRIRISNITCMENDPMAYLDNGRNN